MVRHAGQGGIASSRVYEASEATAYVESGLTPATDRLWGGMPPRAIAQAKAAGWGPEDMHRRIGESPTIGMMLSTGSTLAEIQRLYHEHDSRSQASG